MFPIVLFSTVFFVGGALFGYFVVFPFGFKFFIGFASDSIRALPSIREYLKFATKLLFAFGFIFELPLFSYFLARLGLVNAEMLRSKQKYAILIIFMLGAILTPPDVVTQVMMAGPLLILYEMSIWIAKIFGRKPLDVEEEEEASA
jgi:sec-independent protein translocase protein TatC